MGKFNLQSPWVVLAFLCIPVFVGSLDLTIISAVLPEVMVSLNLPLESRFDDATWAITGYLLAYTISMTFTGRISDIVGRRKVYVIFLLIFMFGSYFVAIAHTWPVDLYTRFYRELHPYSRPPGLEMRTLYMIILGRVIQAVGAGAMAPVTMALVADLFPPTNRARPIGLVGAIDTVGWVLGHLYGGIMVNFFGDHGDRIVDTFAKVGLHISYPDWRTLFMLNLLAGVVTLAAVFIGLRGVPQLTRRERFDFPGTFFIATALICLTIGLGGVSPEAATAASNFGELQRESTDYTLPLLIGAAIAFLIFIGLQSRLRYPLMNLNLFKQRNVSAAAITNVCVGFGLTIGLVTTPLLVNIRAENTTSAAIQDAAVKAGLLLSGLTVPMALAAVPGGWLSDRFGYRTTTVSGMLMATAGFILSSFTWEMDTSFEIMGAEMAIIGIGLGLTISPIGAAVINAAADSERGAASAMVLALRLIGMTLALSSLTTFAVNQVNNQVLVEAGTDAAGNSLLYFEKTVEVINEVLLIGAAVSFVAVLVALLMRGGQVTENQIQEVAP